MANVQRYYSQLQFLKNRFKVGDGHFDFAWYDVYLGIVCNYTDIDYEMCSVLYNVGALHSILGSQETRDDLTI